MGACVHSAKIQSLNSLPLSPLNAHNHLMYLGWGASAQIRSFKQNQIVVYPQILFNQMFLRS